MGATTSGVLAALTSVWFTVIHDCQRQITYEGRDTGTGMSGLHWTAAAQLYPVDERGYLAEHQCVARQASVHFLYANRLRADESRINHSSVTDA